MKGHPQFGTHGHCQRKTQTWPTYLAKRLPDINNIKKDREEDTELTPEDSELFRKSYGQGVLIMFRPFRTLDNIYDNDMSWWHSYTERKTQIFQNPSPVSSIRNIQSF